MALENDAMGQAGGLKVEDAPPRSEMIVLTPLIDGFRPVPGPSGYLRSRQEDARERGPAVPPAAAPGASAPCMGHLGPKKRSVRRIFAAYHAASAGIPGFWVRLVAVWNRSESMLAINEQPRAQRQRQIIQVVTTHIEQSSRDNLTDLMKEWVRKYAADEYTKDHMAGLQKRFRDYLIAEKDKTIIQARSPDKKDWQGRRCPKKLKKSIEHTGPKKGWRLADDIVCASAVLPPRHD